MNENVVELSDVQELNENSDYGIFRKHTGVWDRTGAIDNLLEVVGSEEYIYKLTSANFKKKQVWEEIATKLEARGYPLGDNRCRVAYQKWLNLKKNFITALSKKGAKTPPWFDKLNDIYEKSDGKLLGLPCAQGEEDQEEESDPPLKRMKQEYPSVEEEDVGCPSRGEPARDVVEETNRVTYGDVIAIMQQLEEERRDREEAREKQEVERFDMLANLLKQQNALTEKLISVLSKQTGQTGDHNTTVLPLDASAVCIITTDDMHR